MSASITELIARFPLLATADLKVLQDAVKRELDTRDRIRTVAWEVVEQAKGQLSP